MHAGLLHNVPRRRMPSCAELIQLLQRPSSSPSEQQEAASALAAHQMTPQVWSIAIGALPRLVELMQHPDSTKGVHEQARRALLHVAEYDFLLPGDQVQAASADDLFSLVQLLHGDGGFVQSAAMFALGTLAMHAYNRSQIIKAGAMGRIVLLFKSKSQEVQLSAARALIVLSSEPNSQALALVEAGATASLTSLLKSSSVKLQSAAVSALANFGTVADGRDAIIAAGATPSIVRLLKCKEVMVHERAAAALGNLGSDVANQAIIAAAGAIAPLILLLTSRSEAVQISAAAALCNVTSTPALQARVASAGAVTPLASLLKSRSAELRESAVRALSNLSNHAGSISQILTAGAIDSVVSLLTAAVSTAAHDAAVVFLGNLAIVEACRAPLIAAGAIPKLVTSLSTGSQHVQHMAAAALGGLTCGDPSNKLRIVAAGAVEPLIKLLTSDSEDAQMASVMTLSNLLACEDAAVVQGMLASSGAAVAPLVRVFQRREFPETAQGEAVFCLLTLSARSGSDTRAIAAAGGIPPLIRLLHSGSAQTQSLVVMLLHLMAAEGVPADLAAMEAALPILAKLQGDSNLGSEMRGHTLELLQRINSVGSNRSIGSTGSVDPGSASYNRNDVPPSSISSSIPPAAAEAASPQPPATTGGRKLCWACGATSVPLKKCSVCTVAAYCSGACQKADWKAHKGQCAGLKASVAVCKE